MLEGRESFDEQAECFDIGLVLRAPEQHGDIGQLAILGVLRESPRLGRAFRRVRVPDHRQVHAS